MAPYTGLSDIWHFEVAELRNISLDYIVYISKTAIWKAHKELPHSWHSENRDQLDGV